MNYDREYNYEYKCPTCGNFHAKMFFYTGDDVYIKLVCLNGESSISVGPFTEEKAIETFFEEYKHLEKRVAP